MSDDTVKGRPPIELDYYCGWPYKRYAGEVADKAIKAHESVRALLTLHDDELRAAVNEFRDPAADPIEMHGTISRLAHDAGVLSQMETFLQMMREEAERVASGG